jgi:hypothetical protein
VASELVRFKADFRGVCFHQAGHGAV